MRNKETYTVFNASDVDHQHVERDKEPLQCKLLLREDFGDSVAVLRHDHWVVAKVGPWATGKSNCHCSFTKTVWVSLGM